MFGCPPSEAFLWIHGDRSVPFLRVPRPQIGTSPAATCCRFRLPPSQLSRPGLRRVCPARLSPRALDRPLRPPSLPLPPRSRVRRPRLPRFHLLPGPQASNLPSCRQVRPRPVLGADREVLGWRYQEPGWGHRATTHHPALFRLKPWLPLSRAHGQTGRGGETPCPPGSAGMLGHAAGRLERSMGR